MRLVSYEAGLVWRAGVLLDDRVVDVAAAADQAGLAAAGAGGLGWQSTRAVIQADAETRQALAQAAAALRSGQGAIERPGRAAPEVQPLADVRLGPPIPDPEKIICVGLNYRDHAAEAGLELPSSPVFFAKFRNSLIGDGESIVVPAASDKIDYEAELAVVISRRCRGVAAAEALDYVAGAMAFNDVTARDLQVRTSQWTLGKAIDTFGPCGPALVLMDELGDLQSLDIRARVNGETLQDANTSLMVFGVAEIIAALTAVMTLEPGDIIATGTPAGVGMARDPKRWLKEGDTVEVEIDQIGTLSNPVTSGA